MPWLWLGSQPSISICHERILLLREGEGGENRLDVLKLLTTTISPQGQPSLCPCLRIEVEVNGCIFLSPSRFPGPDPGDKDLKICGIDKSPLEFLRVLKSEQGTWV